MWEAVEYIESSISTDNRAWLNFYWKTDVISDFIHNHFTKISFPMYVLLNTSTGLPFESFMIGSEMVITSRGMFIVRRLLLLL